MGMSPWRTSIELRAIPLVFHMRDITCACGNKWTETTISSLTRDNRLSFEMRPYHFNGHAALKDRKIIGYCVSKEQAAFCQLCFTKYCEAKEIKVAREPVFKPKPSTANNLGLDELFGEPE